MSRAGLAVLAAAAALAAARAIVHGGEDLYVAAVVIAAGLVAGALGLLMVGHLLSEDWLRPVRAEAEALALTAPLVAVLALPIGLDLVRFAPWTAPPEALPPGRVAFLAPSFVLARGGLAVATLSALALWLVGTREPRRASAVGLFGLMPATTVLAIDWALFREPSWWSGLYPFAFAIGQLLGALAIGMAVSLLSAEEIDRPVMVSVERALLTLALLSAWAWFGQFLVVWYGDLPNETAWYLRRAAGLPFAAGAAALVSLAAALACLAPPGVGRRTMLAGALLLVTHHVAHMIFLLRPNSEAGALGAALGCGALAAWSAAGVLAFRARAEAGRPPAEDQGVSHGVRPGT
jgi:hypothetical protein